MEKKYLTPEQIATIYNFLRVEKDFFEDDEREFSKYFELTENQNIIFSDFSHNGTFNLINESYRNNLIQKTLVPEILSFLNKLK